MPQDTSRTIEGYAVMSADSHTFVPWSYHPRPLGDEDVEIQITHCGICASDIHTCFGGWGHCHYPVIVGHEIVGTVSALGSKVTHLQLGQRVGCGAQCAACYNKLPDEPCELCRNGHEQYCPRGVGTYNSKFRDGEIAQGGYASHKRLPANHAFPIPDEISSAEAAPLLCAGSTVFTPLQLFKAGKGMKVGVIGIGGLGHLAVQFASKMGAETIAIGTSESKRELCLTKLGASDFVNLKNEAEVKKYHHALDLVICTANAKGMDWSSLMEFSKSLSTFCLVGLPEDAIVIKRSQNIVERGVAFTGSNIGSLKEIKQMLAFCAQHNVRPLIELLPMSKVNEGIQKVENNDVKFRVVLEQGK